jgi:predicted ATPase
LDAEQWLLRAITVSQEQDALLLELQATLSLARLRMKQNRLKDARQALAPVYDRFTEGFATADLLAVKELLQQLT